MDRRHALSLLAAAPFAVAPFGARLDAQTRPTARHRIVLSQSLGLILEPDGTLKVWNQDPGSSPATLSPAPERMGLGHSDPIKSLAIYPIPNLRRVVAAAAGTANFAVLADGAVLAWGATGSGELGITPREEFETRAQPRMRTPTPTPVAVRFDAVDVSSKSDHVLALARDGSVFAWGRGDNGQLGIGPLPTVAFKTRSARVEPYVPYPVQVPDLEGVTAISAGHKHSLALMKDGTVRTWGLNKYGQMGDGTLINRDRPQPVPGVRNAVAIAAGGYNSAAVLADGTAMVWGATHENLTPRPGPVLVSGARGIRSVAAGDEHFAALTQSGEVMTWGADAHYQIGRAGNASVAGLVRGLANVVSVAAGAGTTIVVLSSGRMMTWGEVPWYMGANGRRTNLSPSPRPVQLEGLEQP